MTDPAFEQQRREFVAALATDEELQRLALQFLVEASRNGYSYNFDWCGLPIIQFPQDIVAVQQLIWRIQPSLVIETGVARGGSLVLSASILELLGGDRRVIGVDIEIRPHNRAAIEAHPLAHRIDLVEGSSVDPAVVDDVKRRAAGREPVLVFLDSMHTHDHVLEELRLYNDLVQPGSYLVVFDTVIEHMPADFFPDRPWGPGDNALTAVHAFLAENDRFEVDRDLEATLQITVATGGYLKCVR